MSLIEVKVPDIGDFDEVAVIELLVKVGDTVKAEQSLITVESDKASMEIPSSTAGVVKELKVALGDKVKQGSVVLVVEAAGAAAAPTAPAGTAPASAPSAAPAAAPAPVAAGPKRSAIGVACPTQVAPEMPRRAIQDGTEGVVKAQILIKNGVVQEVTIVSGPRVFHAAVKNAIAQYKCVADGPEVLATQEFNFKLE